MKSELDKIEREEVLRRVVGMMAEFEITPSEILRKLEKMIEGGEINLT